VTGRPALRTDRLRGRSVTRDPAEDHRAASPLELLFDLTFVVAVSRAAAALHHEIATDHVAEGVVGFGAIFFAIWWAWMNFTWFASAHDSDDVAHRLLTFVQMAGVLVLAAGVTRAVEDEDFLVVTLGYAVMRLALVAAWLRVARDQPAGRSRALRYAAGVGVLQLLWFGRLVLPDELAMAGFLVLAVCELSVPLWAERAADRPIFHPDHIEERYGLFTIIVLGESILSATVGFQTALDETGLSAELLAVGLGGLVLAFAAWWLYFDHPGHLTPSPDVSFRWGYAHVVIFAALAAAGAGVHVATEAVAGHGDARVAALAVAIPVAGFVLGLALVMTITGTPLLDERVWPKLAGAVAMVAIGLTAPVGAAVAGCAAVIVVQTVSMVLSGPDPVGRGTTGAGPAEGDDADRLAAAEEGGVERDSPRPAAQRPSEPRFDSA
jgi:low temperature requirement protein LtrA